MVMLAVGTEILPGVVWFRTNVKKEVLDVFMMAAVNKANEDGEALGEPPVSEDMSCKSSGGLLCLHYYGKDRDRERLKAAMQQLERTLLPKGTKSIGPNAEIPGGVAFVKYNA